MSGGHLLSTDRSGAQTDAVYGKSEQGVLGMED